MTLKQRLLRVMHASDGFVIVAKGLFTGTSAAGTPTRSPNAALFDISGTETGTQLFVPKTVNETTASIVVPHWRCPHCGKSIGSDDISVKNEGFTHRDCGGIILLPERKSFEASDGYEEIMKDRALVVPPQDLDADLKTT